MLTEESPSVYDQYHRLYDNGQYLALTDLLARDLGCDAESPPVTDFMNTITDAALALCGDAHRSDAPQRLAVLCGQDGISPEAVDAVARYLTRFEPPWNTRVADFAATAKALLIGYSVREALRNAAAHANGIHAWRGRAAYELLSASDALTQAALQLLQRGEDTYIREKLQNGLSRITWALYEGVAHADAPEAYDLSSTHFPRAADRR